jgi:hypothetical protein
LIETPDSARITKPLKFLVSKVAAWVVGKKDNTIAATSSKLNIRQFKFLRTKTLPFSVIICILP